MVNHLGSSEVVRMRLSIQILESGLHLMRDGKKCSEVSILYQ